MQSDGPPAYVQPCRNRRDYIGWTSSFVRFDKDVTINYQLVITLIDLSFLSSSQYHSPVMAPPNVPSRSQQRTTTGLGLLFVSPHKRRNKKRTTTYVQPLGLQDERRRLEERLQRLKQHRPAAASTEIQAVEAPLEAEQDLGSPMTVDADPPLDNFLPELPQHGFIEQDEDERRPRRILPNRTAHKLYDKWALVLPRLVNPLLAYVSKSTGQIPERITQIETTCRQDGCVKKACEVLCLFQDCACFLSNSFVPFN